MNCLRRNAKSSGGLTASLSAASRPQDKRPNFQCIHLKGSSVNCFWIGRLKSKLNTSQHSRVLSIPLPPGSVSLYLLGLTQLPPTLSASRRGWLPRDGKCNTAKSALRLFSLNCTAVPALNFVLLAAGALFAPCPLQRALRRVRALFAFFAMAASTLTRLRLPSPNPETLPFESPSNKQSASPTPDALTAAAAAAAASAGRPEMRQRLLRHGRVFEQLTERTLERTAEQRPPLQRAMSDSFRAESISKRGLPSSREGRPFSPSAGFQFASPRFANIFEESSADSGGVGTSSEEESDDGEGGDEESASSENPRMGARRPRFELRANAPADPRSLQRGQPSRRASHEVPLVGEEGTSKASLRESSFAAAVIAEERRLRAAAAAEDKRSALPRLLKTQRESRAAVAPRGFPESESEEDPEDEDGQSSSCSKSSGCSSSEDSTRQADAAFRDSRQARAFAQRNLREVTRRRQAAMERHMQKQRLQLESCQRAFSPREAQNGPSSRGGDLKVKSSHDARRVNGRRGSRCVRPSFGGESSVSQTTVGGDVWQRAAKMTREKSASSASGPSVAPSSLPFASQNAHPPSSFFGPMPPPPPLAFLGWPSAPHLYTAAAAAFAAAAARGGRGAGTETPASAGPPQATGAEGGWFAERGSFLSLSSVDEGK